MLHAKVLNSKIVDDKCEGDIISGKFPKRGSACHWGIAKFGKVYFESVVGDFTSLF